MSAKVSHWFAFRRCLVLVERLLQSPASATELIVFVESKLGDSVWGDNPERAFKRDRDNLKKQFGTLIVFDFRLKVYVLTDLGCIPSLSLTTEQLRTVANLIETFAQNEGHLSGVDNLLLTMLSRLPAHQREQLERLERQTLFDLQTIDSKPIPVQVFSTLDIAITTKCQVQFYYLAPSNPANQAIYHRVYPHRLYFRQGHWYLLAHDLVSHNPITGVISEHTHVARFRLQYIQFDTDFKKLPYRALQHPYRFPQFAICYRLVGTLARGDISRRFQQMTIVRQADGSVLVEGWTDDYWEAARILVGYGEHCQVLGGPEVLAEVKRRIQGLFRVYKDWLYE